MTTKTTTLNHLFDADMTVRSQEVKDAVTSPEGKVGKYMGGGDGEVTGQINGKMYWDLYEDMDGDVCLTNFAGKIETEDGATIRFDARGHGKVVNPERPNDWVMVYGVKFETGDEHYNWLNATLGVWEGEFSMETYKHNYRIYANRYD
ncbi:DUF3237 family protein [Phototrophicus methaneseepsis]|uniref:DUF3237 family protein n=1 Tax=Phototrophicus methaneseepsis TaxID=2710758 RepID=A0A7S8E9W9_9CHLR|nr:DUF3237 family protein [Phototrophicus methaneseepsis]QPC83045.1 DUF3237 family protein [Phototrophicus methaneseepsis]